VFTAPLHGNGRRPFVCFEGPAQQRVYTPQYKARRLYLSYVTKAYPLCLSIEHIDASQKLQLYLMEVKWDSFLLSSFNQEILLTLYASVTVLKT
jgi:hypothetical protein